MTATSFKTLIYIEKQKKRFYFIFSKEMMRLCNYIRSCLVPCLTYHKSLCTVIKYSKTHCSSKLQVLDLLLNFALLTSLLKDEGRHYQNTSW